MNDKRIEEETVFKPMTNSQLGGMMGLATLFLAATLQAATTGWNPTAPGTYAYTDTANWADSDATPGPSAGDINDTFDASLSLTDNGTTGSQVLTFSADYATVGALSFTYTDANTSTAIPYDFTLRSDGVAARTLTLNGDLTFSPVRTTRLLTIGSATATENLHLDLGGAARTFNITTQTGTITGGSPVIPTAGVTVRGAISNGSIVKTGSGWLRLFGADANTFTGLTVSAGVVQLGKTSGIDAVAGEILINGGNLVLLNSNQIANTANVTIESGGLFYAATPASNSSNTPRQETINNLTISGGTFNTSPKNSGSGVNAIANGVLGTMSVSGGTVSLRQTVFSVNRLEISGSSVTVTSTGSGLDSSSHVSRLAIGAGGLEITNIASGAFTPIAINSWAQLSLGGNVDFIGNETNSNTALISAAVTGTGFNLRTFSLTGGTRTFTIGDGAADVDLAIDPDFTIINGAGTGGIIKAGAGTLRIDSTGTYTGGTTVQAGRLLLNGSVASPTVTVDGGVLGGTGTLAGTVTANAGGSVDPGATGVLGTLTAGSTTLAGGTLTIDIGAAEASDVLAVIGDLDLSSLSDTLTIVGAADNSTYTIATYTGTLSGVFNTENLPGDYSVNYGSGSNSAITISVPEPASLSLIALAGAGLLGRRRGRRKP